MDMAKVAPSILAADFANMGRDVGKLQAWGASLVHCDVMDGFFVPNISFGAQLIKAIRPLTPLPLDVHLMITQPERYVEEFVQAGADILTVHQEVTPHLHRVLALIKDCSAKNAAKNGAKNRVRTGVALNPSTHISTIEYVLDMVDLVLIMTCDPGYGGQLLIPAMIDKVAAMKRMVERSGLEIEIEVDGGVYAGNAAALVRAGVDILVAGTAVFDADDPKKAVRELLEA